MVVELLWVGVLLEEMNRLWVAQGLVVVEEVV